MRRVIILLGTLSVARPVRLDLGRTRVVPARSALHVVGQINGLAFHFSVDGGIYRPCTSERLPRLDYDALMRRVQAEGARVAALPADVTVPYDPQGVFQTAWGEDFTAAGYEAVRSAYVAAVEALRARFPELRTLPDWRTLDDLTTEERAALNASPYSSEKRP